MKRKLLSVLLTLCLAFSLLPTAALADEAKVAEVNGTQYETLVAAVDAAQDGDTVKLLRDCSGDGIQIPAGKFSTQGLTIDFDHHTYTLNGTLVGSTGSENQAAQFLKGNKITLKNGIFDVAAEKRGVKILIQNYSDLTLVGMTLDGTNVFKGWENLLTLSNNCGNVVIEDTKIIAPKQSSSSVYGKYAFDVCGFSSYTGVSVTVKGNSEINGNIEVSRSSGNTADVKLSLESGTVNGTLKIDSSIKSGDPTTVTKSEDVAVQVSNQFEWTTNEDGTLTLQDRHCQARIGTTYYPTLEEAVAAAKNNATVTLVENIDLSQTLIIENKTVTINLYGKTISNSNDLWDTGAGYWSLISVRSGANVTITGSNGTLKGKENDCYALDVQDGGELTIKSGTYIGNISAVYVTEGTANINGGTFSVQQRDPSKGCEFTLNCLDENYRNGTAKIIVKGGTFTEFDPRSNAAEGGSNSTDFVASGIGVTKNENGTYTTVSKAVAQIVDENGGSVKAYKKLTDAIAAADGKTIKLLNKIGLTACQTIENKTLTIDLSGFDISLDKDLTAIWLKSGNLTIQDSSENAAGMVFSGLTAISVNSGATLTVKSGTVKGWTAVENSGTVNIEGTANLQRAAGYSVDCQSGSTLNMTNGTVYDIGTSGTVNISGGTVENYVYATSVTGGTIKDLILINGCAISGATITGSIKWLDDTVPTLTNVTIGENATVKNAGYRFNADKTAIEAIVYVASITDAENNTTKYESLQAAVDAVQNDETITILKAGGTAMVGRTVKFTVNPDGKAYSITLDSYCTDKDANENVFDVVYSVPSSGSSGYYVSTPSKTENGSVTVSPKSASKGDTVTVTVKPDSGYVLETLTVTDKNGNELTLKDKGDGKYTFTMPAGKVEVKATFMEDNSVLNFFYDVPNDAYFYEAVKWAVKNGITDGVGDNLFAPEQPCTRAQIVTFLWRAAGSPEPKGAASGMTDVVSGSYYEKAVAWAIENGITTGTTTSTFSPDATCTRAQAVTFLARALNAKAASAAEFSDVPADSYFADAVAWAAANGVTEGIGGGLFGSDNDCTRGQIVTFLYRAYNK